METKRGPQKQAIKREQEEVRRDSGINLDAGTLIRYRKETTTLGSTLKKYEWDTAEIQDSTMKPIAEAALNEQAPDVKEQRMQNNK